MERALEKLTGEHIKIRAASRTDAGAHALGQVAAFQTHGGYPPETFLRGLNFYLPADIRVQAAYEVPSGFHPRRHALRREYWYLLITSASPSALWRAFSHHVPRPLDVDAMGQAAQALVGTHDFAPFCGGLERPGASTVRHLYRAELVPKGEGRLLAVVMEGNAFLPQQVRRTAGALVEVGLGNMGVGEFGQMARSGQPGAAGPTLPARGLFLVRVSYAHFPPAEGSRSGEVL